MSGVNAVDLVGSVLMEHLDRVRSYELVHAVAGAPLVVGQSADQRQVGQRLQGGRGGLGNRSGRFATETTDEDGKPRQCCPASRAHRSPGAVENGVHAAMPVARARVVGGQEIGAAVDLDEEVAGGQGPDPRRRQLDGQREAVDAFADRVDRRHVVGEPGIPGEDSTGAVVEQFGRLAALAGARLHAHRRHGDQVFVRRSQRHAAGRQHGQTRASGEQFVDQTATRRGHVLSVVHDQQQLPVDQRARPAPGPGRGQGRRGARTLRPRSAPRRRARSRVRGRSRPRRQRTSGQRPGPSGPRPARQPAGSCPTRHLRPG